MQAKNDEEEKKSTSEGTPNRLRGKINAARHHPAANEEEEMEAIMMQIERLESGSEHPVPTTMGGKAGPSNLSELESFQLAIRLEQEEKRKAEISAARLNQVMQARRAEMEMIMLGSAMAMEEQMQMIRAMKESN